MTVVLDSWAIVRLLEGAEPAAGRVQEQIDSGETAMSWITLGEVFYVLRREHGEAAAGLAIQDIEACITVVLPDRGLILEAARIKSDYPLSYADAFAAATAVRLSASLWTGDPELMLENAPWLVHDPSGDER